MADTKLWSKLDSTDVEDAGDLGRIYSMRPVMSPQRHCNCIHDALPHNPGARPSRNLVVCIDGTANQFSDKNTNVVELYSRLEKRDHLQVTFYNSGIGTYASPSWKSLTYYRQVISHKIDLAIAWRFEKILLSAYRWLCEQYQTGDRIFLFGFSRGAYQVRALSAMIEKVGLIHRGNEAQIPFAYDLYQKTSDNQDVETLKEVKLKTKPGDRKESTGKVAATSSTKQDINKEAEFPSSTKAEPSKESESANTSAEDPVVNTSKAINSSGDDAASSFKRTFCREDVKVHFVGVWDSVSSVGFAKKKELPLTTEGMKHVCIFRHALALDERRVKFLPEYVNGGLGPETEQDMGITAMPHTKEVWFTGTHSDIGGGNTENKWLNKNGPALRWMTTEASKAGLSLTPFAWNPENVTKGKDVNESLTGFWRLLEILPIKRLSYEDKQGVTRRPHLGGRRKVLPGQLVHRSVYGSDRLHLEYKEDLGSWNGKDPTKIEPDNLDQVTNHIDSAIELLSNMEAGFRITHLNHLIQTSYMFGTDEAIQAYINLSQTLFHSPDLTNSAIRRRVLATMQVLQYLASTLFQKQHLSRQPPVIRELLSLDERDKIQKQEQESIMEFIKGFLLQFGTPEIFSIRRNGPVASFAFSPDGDLIACGTYSGNIFFRHARTGAEVHRQWNTTVPRAGARISCLAFSKDGKLIASGGWDSWVRVWDAETGMSVKQWLLSPQRNVSSVSFCCDGSLVATSEYPDVVVFQPGLNQCKTMPVPHQHDVLSAIFTPQITMSVDHGASKQPDTSADPRKPVDSATGDSRTDRQPTTTGSNPHTSTDLAKSVDTTSAKEQTGKGDANTSIDMGKRAPQGPHTTTSTEPVSRSSSISVVTAPSSPPDETGPQDKAAVPNHTSPRTSTIPSTTDKPTNAGAPTQLPNGPHTYPPSQTTQLNGIDASNAMQMNDGKTIPPGSDSGQLPPPTHYPQTDYTTTYLVLGARDKRFSIWDHGNPFGVPQFSFPLQDEIRAVALSGDGSKVYFGLRDGAVSRLDFGRRCIDGSWMASAQKDVPPVLLPQCNLSNQLSFSSGERIPVNSLAVAPNSSTKIVCGLDDGRVTLWDLTWGTARLEYQVPHSSSIMSVSFSPDGSRYAACTKEGIVFVYDANGPAGGCILEQLKNNDQWFS
ncbi:hypothetical protein VNI00_000891 [Paramarasmius palmivorus]|uniref:WD40 repeat-like protein n=1 Tax=Paramarasmius palmivorus TaxID=297713 RepID=A0AAW0E8M8_9AGAR